MVLIYQKKTIYNLTQDNNCHIISCDSNWRNKQNLIVLKDNNYNSIPDNTYFNGDENYISLNNRICPDNLYLIEEKNQCVNDCKQYPDFPYGFQNKCYKSCPVNISEISLEK